MGAGALLVSDSLLQYIGTLRPAEVDPPAQRQIHRPEQEVAPTERPPLGLKTVRGDYYGKKAYDYELNRDSDQKWLKEFDAVHQGLSGITGPVLDIPCGTGRFFEVYESLGLSFIGRDVSHDMLVQAQAKCPGGDIAIGDIEHIDLPDNLVEASVVIRFLDKLPEDEMAVVLKEVGRVTLRRILAGNIIGDRVERRRRSWVHRFDVFKQAVHDAGFKIVGKAPIRPPEMNVWMLEAV
jgi:SAM-dependent methyltransferase